MKKEIREEIWKHFGKNQKVYLSTADGDSPKVRPVTMILQEDKFWIATGSQDAKIKQLKTNPHFEICYSITDKKNEGYIRLSGKIEIINEIKVKKKIQENNEFIQYFWKEPTDPGYALLHLNITNIEYLRIGEMLAKRYKI